MKRLLATILVTAMAISFSACSGSNTAATTAASAETTAAPAETTAAQAETTAAQAETTATSADAGSGSIFDDPDAPVFDMKLASTFSDTEHPVGRASVYFAELIKERSKGKINVDVYGSSLLGGDRDILEAEQLGTIDLIVSGPALANFLPEYEIMNMPFLFQDFDHAYAALEGDFGKSLFDKLEPLGLVGLDWMDNGFYDLMQGKIDHVTSYEDIKGLNIRTVESAGYLSGWKAIGCNPVPMAATEVYTAMETGAVDGICLSITGTHMLGVYQANQKCYTILYMYIGALPVIASKITWESLPAEYQDLIRECMHEACLFERKERLSDQELFVQDYLDYGLNVEELDAEAREAWAEKVRSEVYPEYPDIVTEESIKTIDSYRH